MIHDYSVRFHGARRTASELIMMLDHTDPIHRAKIGEIWSVCKAGESYSGEAGDKLPSAAAELWRGPRQPATYETAWVERWRKADASVIDAIRWAKSQQTATA